MDGILKLLETAPNIAIFLGIVYLIVIISLIFSIYAISSNTKDTYNELKCIKEQNEYICQALQYIINNDNTATKPQYIKPKTEQEKFYAKMYGDTEVKEEK